MNPDMITNQFGRMLKRNGIVNEDGSAKYHFHCLRHFAVSYLHAKCHIPDAYIMARGGWENDDVLKNVYRHILDQEEKKNAEIANKAFENAFFEPKKEEKIKVVK